jgi:hypothetical protein
MSRLVEDLVEDVVELDVLVNRALGGKRETISARLGKKIFRGTATPQEQALCQLLEFLETDHCLKSYARRLDRPVRRRRRESPELDDEVAQLLGGR